MGTTITLALVCASKATADAVAKKTFATISSYEQKFSRFLANSELSKINREKRLKVSAEFIQVLEKSLELTQKTNNAFNPLVQVATLGYTKSYEHIKESTQGVNEAPYSTDTTLIKIDRNNHEVSIDANQQLDFGGILKGYLSELLADTIIEDSNIQGCIVNIGGDLSVRGFDNIHKPFIFFLYNPVTGAETPVTIKSGSLATSGTYKRKWSTASGENNHIVDTNTQNNPKNNLVSTSIITKSGAEAEALCKLFLTKGVAAALKIMPPEQHNYLYFVTESSGITKHNLT